MLLQGQEIRTSSLVRLNAGNTALLVTIADAAVTGNNVADNVAIADDDYVTLQCIPVDTPTSVTVYWGLVGYIPAGAPPTGIQDKSAHMGSKLVAAGII